MRNIRYTLQKGKRVVLILLAFLFLFSSVTTFAAVILFRDPGGNTAPIVTVTVVGVDEGKYLEVGLNVNSKDYNLQAVGALLEYDPLYLTPVYWDEVEAEPEPPGGEEGDEPDGDTTTGAKMPEPIEIPITAVDWETAIALPTKGPDMLSGKTALAYIAEDKAYLYLSAESPRPETLDQTEHMPKDLYGTMPGTDGNPMWDTEGETTVDDATLTTAPVTSPIDQVVTVRFVLEYDVALAKVKDELGETDFEALSADEKLAAAQDVAVKTIKVVADSGANHHSEDSPVGDSSGVVWFAGVNGVDTPVVLEYAYIHDGMTVYSGGEGGGSNPEDYRPIVFFDWDGVTLLGSVVIDKNATTVQIQEAVTRFQNSISAKLSDKGAYNFGCWIDFNSKDPTNYGVVPDLGNVGSVITLPQPTQANFSIIPDEGKVVKAAYEAIPTELSSLSTADLRRYTVEILYGDQINATTYSLTVRVTRNNGTLPVHRTRDMALRVQQTTSTGSAQILSFIDLPDQDEVVTTIVVPTSVSTVTAFVIDNGTGAIWATAGSRGDMAAIPQTGNNGFVRLGYVGVINNHFRTNSAASVFNAVMVSNLGLTLTIDNVFGAITGDAAAQLRPKAYANMLAAWKELNGITGTTWGANETYLRLTHSELVKAIATGGYVPD